MGEKRGRGNGMGQCVLLPTHNGQPLSAVRDSKKLCIILAYLFVNLINTTVKHPDNQRKEASTHDIQSPKVWGAAAPQE